MGQEDLSMPFAACDDSRLLGDKANEPNEDRTPAALLQKQALILYNWAMRVNDPKGLKYHRLTEHPMVGIAHLDYLLSPSDPLNIERRSGPTHVTTVYNVHAGFEVGVILSGQEERLFPDVVIPVKEGDVYLAAPWEFHGTRSFGGYARVLVLIFHPEFLRGTTLGDTPWLNLFAVPARQRPRVTTGAMRARILELGEQMWKESEQGEVGAEEAVRLNLSLLLLTLRRGWDPIRFTTATVADRGNDLARLMPALTTTYLEPTKHIPVDDAASACGFSRRRFTSLFRETMGVSFAQFRLRTRMVVASHLLLSSDVGVETVSECSGFASVSHFYRCFSRQYGCTPGEYRLRLQAAEAPEG